MTGAPQAGIQSADMVGLYSGHAIKLWVEDMMTRAYLQDCWNDPQIGFLIAGSNEGVVSVVNHAREDGITHVFGLIDRDFGISNRNRWHAADGPCVFRPDVHEIENELLAPTHLAGCDLNNQARSAPDVTARLQTRGGLNRLASDEQRVAKTTASNLRLDPANSSSEPSHIDSPRSHSRPRINLSRTASNPA
jgi:hypothetical protein